MSYQGLALGLGIIFRKLAPGHDALSGFPAAPRSIISLDNGLTRFFYKKLVYKKLVLKWPKF